MAKAWGWTKDQYLDMTFRQLRYYGSEGKVPRVGHAEFGSQSEARIWREEQKRIWDNYDWDS